MRSCDTLRPASEPLALRALGYDSARAAVSGTLLELLLQLDRLGVTGGCKSIEQDPCLRTDRADGRGVQNQAEEGHGEA